METTKHPTYAEFLRAQKWELLRLLDETIAAPDAKMTLEFKGVLNGLSYVLACHLDPAEPKRRDQMIELGVPAKMTMLLIYSGSQRTAATMLIDHIVKYDLEIARRIAVNLKEIVDQY